MTDRSAPRELLGRHVRLTPTTEADAPALRAIHSSPEVARWWERPEPGFPMHDEPDATRFTIWHEGEIAGLIQYSEETEPKYRHASMDIFLGGAFQRRGIGTAAVALLVDHLVHDRGHHRVTIDPAADNEAAVACYAKVGFEPVGIMRKAERDVDGRGWHDSLLMEVVVEPGASRRALNGR